MVTEIARAWSARFVGSIARFAGAIGLTPNTVTILGFFLTALVAFILAQGHLQLAGFLLIVTLGTDAIDGTLARATNSITRFGAFLDSTLDRWTEVLVYLALTWYYLGQNDHLGVMLAVVAMATSMMVSYTRPVRRELA